MILTVVGSGTALPSVERGSPCCHLDVGGENVVFDLGSGSVRQLLRLGVDIRRVRLLALSHFHPDHTADLVPLLFALRNPRFDRDGRTLILGPAGLKGLLAKLEGVYGDWIRPRRFEVDAVEIEPGRVRFGSWELSAAPTGHTPESLAYRVDFGGRSVVYGGDSPFSERLVELARGADLLVLECSFPEGAPREGHLVPSLAAAMAAEAGAKRLLLTHFYPETEGEDLLTPAAARFDGEIMLARDGTRVEV